MGVDDSNRKLDESGREWHDFNFKNFSGIQPITRNIMNFAIGIFVIAYDLIKSLDYF